MAYPNTLDTFAGTTAAGTSLLSSPDHALDHRTLGSAAAGIEAVIGTTGGTSIAMNFAAGDFAARINSSNVLRQIVQGTINNSVLGTPAITGGTANAITLGTPVIGTVSVPGTVAALSFSAAIAPGVGTVTDAAGGTLTVNAQQGQIFYSALGTAAGNRTVGTPLNPTSNQLLEFAFKASGSANGTLVWSGAFRMSQDVGTPAIGTGTTWNYYAFRYNTIDSLWDYHGQSTNVV